MSKKIEIAARVNRYITEALKQRAVFEDGKSFKNIIQSLQLKTLLESEEDSYKVREDAKVYATDVKMYEVPPTLTLESGSSLLKLHFSKIRTSRLIKVYGPGGQQVSFGAEQIREG